MRLHCHQQRSQREYSFDVGNRRLSAGTQPCRAEITLRDAALNLLDGAIETLTHHRDDEAVHVARKAAKRLRAVLRLMQRCLGPIAYHRENARLRDAAKPLTLARDTSMLRSSLRTMPYRPVALRRGLDAEYQQQRADLESRGARAAVAKFQATRHWLAELKASDSEIGSAIAGVKKSYKAGRRALAQAQSKKDQALHEWRKQAKYLLNQLEVLRGVFNVEFRKLHRQAGRIGDILGTDHDLGILSSKLRLYDSSNHALARHIKKRRRKLQAQALQLGKKLYRRSPKRIETAVSASFARSRL
jgi:CHAD domain-containing protein